ncbi:MAG: NAD(P)/FAD-dependent oxidoreductase [Acidobacteriota bacterium]
MTTRPYDVLIAGGGLAGLCLARQLTREAPSLSVLLVEKRPHPVPEAAFKVGESSVEIAAHYFERVLGLASHLRGLQLEKFGLRYFFPAGDNSRLEARFELGPSAFPPVPSFQLDRGRLENFLLKGSREAGVDVRDDCRIAAVELDAPLHRMTLQSAAGSETVEGRWLIDASGRTGLLRRRLGVTRTVGHDANACWFRFPRRLKIDDWSSEPRWQARVPSGDRWLSTNHLMGVGYWVWLIPLGSGGTSVGIVVDATRHPYARLNRFDRALEWLREFEPQCAAVVEANAPELEDFLALRGFAYGCSRVYSPERWALVGEAGLFTDPFYSPGSDFIAMGNDFVVDLIRRERAGEDVSARAERHNTTYLRLFEAFLRLYEGQYPIMGNAQVMTAKVAWDNACYWSITALLFFQRRYVDLEFMASIDPLLRRFFVLHARMQQFLRAWSDIDAGSAYGAGFTSVVAPQWLCRLQAELVPQRLTDETLRARLTEHLDRLERFARALQAMAREAHGDREELRRYAAAPVDGEDAIEIEPLRVAPVATHALS